MIGAKTTQRGGEAMPFNLQVATPNSDALQQAEAAISHVDGVISAMTTSVNVGGTSVMRVTYPGDVWSLQAALQRQGWQAQAVNGKTLRISR